MTDEEQHRQGRRDDAQERDKAKFADFVQIHTIEGKVITRADEKKILEEGLTRFGLDFREAQGILLSVAAEREIALVSHVEHHIDIFLQQVVKRGKVPRRDFNKANELYRKMTNDTIPVIEIRTRIKQMMEHNGWSGKRRRWLLGSRRWFKKI
ncbi:MAG: hypothetical protein HN732_09720 [Rhodospirillaceae bacterium]|nr:hypothetical protein [Rhodospirillaceae bacterium]